MPERLPDRDRAYPQRHRSSAAMGEVPSHVNRRSGRTRRSLTSQLVLETGLARRHAALKMLAPDLLRGKVLACFALVTTIDALPHHGLARRWARRRTAARHFLYGATPVPAYCRVVVVGTVTRQ